MSVETYVALQYRCRRCDSLFLREQPWNGSAAQAERELKGFAESSGRPSRYMPAMDVHSKGCSFNGVGVGDLAGYQQLPKGV